MDKELLRVVIIAIGLIVIMGMLAWSYIKKRNAERDADLFDDLNINGKINESLVVHGDNDDFDIVPKKSSRYDSDEPVGDMFANFSGDFELEEDENEPAPRFVTPEIIQFSVVAKANEGFNGLDLVNAFNIVGLEYGSLKIFERLDPNRLVDFGVANMEKPGTFPETDLETYFCRGVVFFMQPNVLDNPVAVFDDFIDTIKLLAIELDGEMLDHQRKPLTDTTVELIRQSL
ncbi:MAG: cell division protein ZipA C-terminal FtsZ-binding domain-containing protein [Methylococcaceae bacterium]